MTPIQWILLSLYAAILILEAAFFLSDKWLPPLRKCVFRKERRKSK